MHEAVLEYILGNDDRPLRCLKARVLHTRAIIVSVICLCISGCMSPHGNEAAALLADIAAADGPSQLRAITPEPARSLIGYRGPNAGDAIADLYEPAEQPRGAVVLVPGLTPYGKDDPRLVSFARSLARDRFLVLVPEIANTRLLKVSAADSAIIADAIEELARRFAAGADPSVGLVAISFGAGPALLAAGETPAGRHVRFAVTIGAYYDIAAAIAFATTGAYQTPDGSSISVEPNAYGEFVFLRGNADRVRDPQDRTLLMAIADRRLANPASSIADLVGRLGPEGRAVYDLIDNRDPRLVPKLLAQLPGAVQQELRSLDLQGRELPWLRGPVFLVHGKDDTVIPAGESMKLAGALGPRAELYLVEQFAHVDAGTAGLSDNLRLWRVVIRVLEERDRPIQELPH
jgi:pimeloyl-ACP methyl ester carboxylesterase